MFIMVGIKYPTIDIAVTLFKFLCASLLRDVHKGLQRDKTPPLSWSFDKLYADKRKNKNNRTSYCFELVCFIDPKYDEQVLKGLYMA